jgi:hypothetical protein
MEESLLAWLNTFAPVNNFEEFVVDGVFLKVLSTIGPKYLQHDPSVTEVSDALECSSSRSTWPASSLLFLFLFFFFFFSFFFSFSSL